MEWDKVEKILIKYLVSKNIPTYVYLAPTPSSFLSSSVSFSAPLLTLTTPRYSLTPVAPQAPKEKQKKKEPKKKGKVADDDDEDEDDAPPAKNKKDKNADKGGKSDKKTKDVPISAFLKQER